MNTVQRIAKNMAVLSLASVINTALGFFFIMYVARYLGVAGFGILSFALAFAALFQVFTDAGLNILTIREVARDKSLAGKYLSNSAALKLLLSLLTFGAIALVINLLGYPEETIFVVYIVALSVILDSFNLTFHAIFQAYERMEYVTVSRVFTAGIRLGSALVAISLGYSIMAFAFIYLLASAVSLAFCLAVSLWKFAKLRLQIDLVFWKQLLLQAWPFALVMIFGTICYWIDSVMLSVMKGDEVVGWYNAAYRLVVYLIFIPNAYFYAVFPNMSRFYVSAAEALRFIYEKSVKYMGLIAVPIAVGTTILARPIILLIFREEYAQSIIALQILIWSLVFIFVSGIFAHLFNSVNRQVIHAKVVGITALLNIILNLILIPKYSYVGASIATVATEFVALILVYFWSRRIGYGIAANKLAGIVVRVTVASAVMGVFVYFLRDITIWGLVPAAAIVYFIVFYIIRGLDREDVQLFWQLVKKPKTFGVEIAETEEKF